MKPACPVDDESCKTVVARDFGHFTRKSSSSRSEADAICNGQAIFFNTSNAFSGVDKLSIYDTPVDSFCYTHQGNYRVPHMGQDIQL
jgi:imidazoleglycerol phosphate synthase glutamine amidotransferase subunit HisH